MHPPLTWHIFLILMDFIFLLRQLCVLNQACGQWLLSDALDFTISLSLKLKHEENYSALVENENDDSIINIELRLFIYNIDLFYA